MRRYRRRGFAGRLIDTWDEVWEIREELQKQQMERTPPKLLKKHIVKRGILARGIVQIVIVSFQKMQELALIVVKNLKCIR